MAVSFSNHRAVRDDGVFGDDDDAVADVVELVVGVVGLAGGGNGHVVGDGRILVNDGVFDFAIGADADAGLAFTLMLEDGFLGLVIVAAEAGDAGQLLARAPDGPQPDGAVG